MKPEPRKMGGRLFPSIILNAGTKDGLYQKAKNVLIRKYAPVHQKLSEFESDSSILEPLIKTALSRSNQHLKELGINLDKKVTLNLRSGDSILQSFEFDPLQGSLKVTVKKKNADFELELSDELMDLEDFLKHYPVEQSVTLEVDEQEGLLRERLMDLHLTSSVVREFAKFAFHSKGKHLLDAFPEMPANYFPEIFAEELASETVSKMVKTVGSHSEYWREYETARVDYLTSITGLLGLYAADRIYTFNLGVDRTLEQMLKVEGKSQKKNKAEMKEKRGYLSMIQQRIMRLPPSKLTAKKAWLENHPKKGNLSLFMRFKRFANN